MMETKQTKEAPETRREIRFVEMRAKPNDDGKMLVEGRAVIYESPTVMYEFDGVKYYEVIQRGALDEADLKDVPFKYNHSDAIMIMARTRNNTLKLTRDEQGLWIEAELADTTAGRDLYALIKRGDITQMSFAFTVAEESYDSEARTRKIVRFKRIWDVSAVDLPAYPDTSISARSYFEAQATAEAEARAALESEQQKKAADAAERRRRLALAAGL
jgi:HK97 family phage prohead protease